MLIPVPVPLHCLFPLRASSPNSMGCWHPGRFTSFSFEEKREFHSFCLCGSRSDCVFNLLWRGWPREKLPKECKLFTNEYELSAHKGGILWGKNCCHFSRFLPHYLDHVVAGYWGNSWQKVIYVRSRNWSAWIRLKLMIPGACLRNSTKGTYGATGSDLEYLLKTTLIMQDYT